MPIFFATFAWVTLSVYLAALVGGHSTSAIGLPISGHLLLGISAAILLILVHSLVIAIFAGAGKDTRLLSKDLQLDPAYYERIRQIRFKLYPQTLKSVLLTVAVVLIGGFSHKMPGFQVIHFSLAWLNFFYAVFVVRKQFLAVQENSRILDAVNQQALEHLQEGKGVDPSGQLLPGIDEMGGVPWGAHVYAFGRFLIFLSFNVWLPYIYFKFNVGYLNLPVWPFALSFLILWLSGWGLKKRYQRFRSDLYQVQVQG